MARSVLRTPVSLDFSLWAIASSLKDYRICWHLNNTLGIEFERRDDLEIATARGRTLWFSLFAHNDSVQKLTYYLIGNRCETEYLVPELRGNDFFLMIKGFLKKEEGRELITRLRSITGLQAVFSIEPSKLSSVHNLIIDDEEF